MTAPRRRRVEAVPSGQWETIRRAFAEFLLLPTIIIVTFLAVAAGLYFLETADPAWLEPARRLLRTHVFANAQATADLLGTIAGSLITVASITISLLLVALQQTAASLSTEVFDQFLRRRHNQFHFGFFVGLALFALVTLATVNDPFNPVLAASIVFILTVFALFLLCALLYTAINQMRPVEIIEEIHRHTVVARLRQLELIRKTRRSARTARAFRAEARAERHGYVTHIDLGALGTACAPDDIEVVLRVSVGSFVSTADILADITSDKPIDGDALADTVCGAIRLARQRDIVSDPANGVEELEAIAWTSISTSKSNPTPGLLAIRSLRDLLARWASDQADADPGSDQPDTVPVVYTDTVPALLMDAFESLAVVSSESMQHQAYAEITRVFAVLFDRLSPELQRRAEDVIVRILPALGDHVLTADLQAALSDLAATLRSAGRAEVATAVERARDRLGRTVGELHSRATRAVPRQAVADSAGPARQ